jgi:ribonuclease HII
MVTVGIDEVGRGCWAGPVVAGAVILQEPIAGLKDSKLLSKKRRDMLAGKIHESASVGLGWVQPADVDELGLTAAVKLAMERALQHITVEYDELIVDGSYNFFSRNPKARAVIKADALFPAVSAASIVAKVARDNYMSEAAKLHPNYGFEKHVGYGTKMHIEMLKLHGVSEMHRLTYKPIQALLQLRA